MVATSSRSNRNSDDDDDSEEADSAGKKKFESSKLISDCCDENNYVIYYRNLKLYLRLGLKVTFIHRVVAFQQEKWLKPYIQLNTKLRKIAKNAFQRDFYNLMNNSVFGKIMENVRNDRYFQLVSDTSTLS